MKILLVSPQGDGAWYVWLLRHNGHDVDWLTTSEKDVDILSGIVPPPLKRAPDPSAYDLIVFDSSGLGDAADLARQHTPTIGGSELADRLEHDRIFGFEAMQAHGINVPDWEPFSDTASAISWLKKTGKRTVLKPLDDEKLTKDTTYVSKSAEDMIRFIEEKLDPKVHGFVLQEFVSGTEVATEAWWTGSEWVALNHTLEEKKFMSGSIGPNTGCSGNVLWMPPRRNSLFERGLERIAPLLREHNFVGSMDLNTIVTDGEIYGLEWTPRFGYEGTCNLTHLLPMEFGEFLHQVATGQTPTLGQSRGRFCASLRLSVPPYPNAETSRRRDKVPIKGIDPDCLESFILYDVQMVDGCMLTRGLQNAIGCPMALSETICGAFDDIESCIKHLDIPNLQYRNDVRACVEKRYAMLRECGWLRPIG